MVGGCGFESQHRILDGRFSHLFGRGWPILKKYRQIPLYTKTGLHYLSPPFLHAFESGQYFSLYDTKDSTLTFIDR